MEINELWRIWKTTGDVWDLLKLIVALIRAGREAEALELIAANAGLLEGSEALIELEARMPGIARLISLLRRIGLSESTIEWLRRNWRIWTAMDEQQKLRALRAALQKLLDENPGLRPLQELIERLQNAPTWFAQQAKFIPESAAFPVAIGFAEVLFIFAAGLLLPASKMGDLTLDDDSDRDKWFELIAALYRQHIKDRADYRGGTSKRTRTQLLEDADYLWKLVQAFLRRYPDHDQRSLLLMIERAAGGWVRQYLGWDEDTLQPAPPISAPSAPAPLPPRPPPVQEHPHTVERPQTYDEWIVGQKKSDAQRIRNRIIVVRKRIRELLRKRGDPNYASVTEDIDESIKKVMEELARLRKQLEDMNEDSGEDMDEPYEAPPQAPLPPWPLGHNWANPYRLYVNPRTGEQRWFSDPPPGGDWERMDGPDGQPQFHWGWTPDIDPETGKVVWKPGWLPGPPSTPPYMGTLALPK
jgi:hypothetical protein